jgi:hypothetical protein
MGLGDFLGNLLGTSSEYQAASPFGADVTQQNLQNQANVNASQIQLAQQLAAQTQGQGPNPAQQQYQQNVQQNVANAQGLISSQRGLNPALAARMGVNAAAQANNQAAGQSGILQAQQQLAAQQQLGGLYGQMQNANLGQMGVLT